MLSASILEAMSCGALVLASDTGPVRDVVQHGENGFLADLHDPTSLARAVTDVLQKAPALMPVRHHARTTILEHYDIQKNLAHHAALLLGR